MPSVAAQTFGDLGHMIVSDGPDQALAHYMKRRAMDGFARWICTPEPGGHWGHEARLEGIRQSDSEFIGWLDDDDAYRPEHVALMVAALDASPGAGWAYGRMLIGAHFRAAQRHRNDVDACCGMDPFEPGHVLTSMIFHRRALLDVATWGTGSQTPDRDLVQAWTDAGVACVPVPVVSVDMFEHPAQEQGF